MDLLMVIRQSRLQFSEKLGSNLMDKAQFYRFFSTSQGGYHPKLEPVVRIIICLQESFLSPYIFQSYIGDLVALRLCSFGNSLKFSRFCKKKVLLVIWVPLGFISPLGFAIG